MSNPAALAILAMLKLHEGYRQHPYKDMGDALTVGYGRNLTDNGITESEATYLLLNDINRAWDDLHQAVPAFRSMDDVRKAVLVDMCVNMGIRRLLRFVKMFAAIASGNYAKAADEMLDSAWCNQVGTRAGRLAGMMRTGRWPPGLEPVSMVPDMVPTAAPSKSWLDKLLGR